MQKTNVPSDNGNLHRGELLRPVSERQHIRPEVPVPRQAEPDHTDTALAALLRVSPQPNESTAADAGHSAGMLRHVLRHCRQQLVTTSQNTQFIIGHPFVIQFIIGHPFLLHSS